MRDTEEQIPIPDELGETSFGPSLRGRRALMNVKRELTEEDMESPAVKRMLVNEIDKLEQEKQDLVRFRERFHEVDKLNAVLSGKMNVSLAKDVLFTLFLSAGSAVLGFVPSLWVSQPNGYIALVFALFMLIAGVIAKVFIR